MRLMKFLIIGCLTLSGCDSDMEVPVDPTDFESGLEDSDIPFVSINASTAIPDEPKIAGEMVIFQNQEPIFSNGIGIELRGSTSRRLFAKKSYGIELWDVSGADVSEDIFGFGKEEDWILYGPYSDKSLMRNALIYEFSNEMGQYAPKTEFVEFNLNDEFNGLYVFMEKIKRDGDRLDLFRLEPNVTDASLITGGYILKIDKTSGDSGNSDWPGDAAYTAELGFRSDYDTRGERLILDEYGPKNPEETYFLYEYPSENDINGEQKNYIKNYIKSFEEALIAENFSGSTRNYEDYIDVESFVDFFILSELSSNPDSYRLSTYLHKDRGSKLKMGPIWDFNLAFGNDGRSVTDRWVYQYNEFFPDDLWLVHFWWPKLLEDPKFRETIKSRWTTLRGNLLSDAMMAAQVDRWVDYLESNGAIDRNFETWPVLGEALPFNSFVGETYTEEIDYLKGWIEQRANWMDAQIGGW